jgi:hypothetical protein
VTKKLICEFSDDTWAAIEAMRQAHDEWLTLARAEQPEMSHMEPWSVSDVVNYVLGHYCPSETETYQYTARLLRAALADDANDDEAGHWSALDVTMGSLHP